ncbi:MAG: hypothetical protein H6R01_904 [Burkholderiaceae bacterium]|nr:hypothetical protein [Burkholderiaceae bacterium]
MAYSYQNAKEIKHALQALPPLDDAERHMTNKELVVYLKDTIAEKKRQGYSIDKIGEELRKLGVQISVASLKSYARTKRHGSKQKTQAQTKSEGKNVE